MKTYILLSFIVVLVVASALLSSQAQGQIQFKGLNHPGIKWSWPIKADQYTFVVNTTSNYDVQNVTFNKDSKTLSFLGNSSHTGNIAEIEIPSNLIGGNYTIYQNGNQISPVVLKNGNLTTVILKFNDTGNLKTDVTGTTYLPEFSGIAPAVMVMSFGILFLTLRHRRI
ncbi:MAG TPA: hypothetical protein VJ792_06550 [Candidatus Nitrosotalea sp.]|nr:hypothetical protein [Candidatus Nitrosotalea sp.]